MRLRVIEKELDDRFGAVLEWDGDTAAVLGRGVKGTVRVDDVGLRVSLRVSLFFLPLVPLIRREIERALDGEFPTRANP